MTRRITTVEIRPGMELEFEGTLTLAEARARARKHLAAQLRYVLAQMAAVDTMPVVQHRPGHPPKTLT